MFNLIKLLVSGLIKISKGNIKVFGMDMGLLPIFYVYLLTKEYLLKDKDARTKFYFLAWSSGLLIMKRFEEEVKIKDPKESYLYGMDLATFMGFGEFKTLEYSVGDYALFEVPNNPLIKYFYPSKEPVDYFISAFQAGGGSVSHRNIIENLELECGAMTGKPSCLFLNATIDEFKRRKVYKELERRIDIKKILPFQKEIFNMQRKGVNDEDILKRISEILELL